MQLESLEKLYVDELRLMYSAENQLAAVLPRALTAANMPELKMALRRFSSEAEMRAQRIDRIFKTRVENSGGVDSAAVRGMAEDADRLTGHYHGKVLDAGRVVAVQRMLYYMIAGYGVLAAWANLLEDAQAIALLNQSLEEERNAAAILEEMAIHRSKADNGE